MTGVAPWTSADSNGDLCLFCFVTYSYLFCLFSFWNGRKNISWPKNVKQSLVRQLALARHDRCRGLELVWLDLTSLFLFFQIYLVYKHHKIWLERPFCFGQSVRLSILLKHSPQKSIQQNPTQMNAMRILRYTPIILVLLSFSVLFDIFFVEIIRDHLTQSPT